MEVNAVVMQNETVPPGEAKQEDCRETGDFASRLKEAGGGQKPENAAEVKKGGKKKPQPCSTQTEDGSGENKETQQIVCISVCVQRIQAKETDPAGQKPDESAAAERQPGNLILVPGKDAPQSGTIAPDAGGETSVLKETAPVIETAPVLDETAPEAEEFAGKVLREMKQRLERPEFEAEKTAQTAGKEIPTEDGKPAQTAGKEKATQAPLKDARPDGRVANGLMIEETQKKNADGPREPLEATGEPAAGKAAKPGEAHKAAEHPETAKTVFQLQTEIAAVTEKTTPDASQTPRPPVAMENIFSEMVERVAAEAKNGKSELFVQLKPEHLGGLSISLAMGGDGLTAKIVTGQQSVHSMLQGGIAGLQEALREKGIQVAHLEIQYDAGPGTGNPSGGRRDWTAQPGYKIAADAAVSEEAAIFYYNLSGYEVLAEQGGSVEFCA